MIRKVGPVFRQGPCSIERGAGLYQSGHQRGSMFPLGGNSAARTSRPNHKYVLLKDTEGAELFPAMLNKHTSGRPEGRRGGALCHRHEPDLLSTSGKDRSVCPES